MTIEELVNDELRRLKPQMTAEEWRSLWHIIAESLRRIARKSWEDA